MIRYLDKLISPKFNPHALIHWVALTKAQSSAALRACLRNWALVRAIHWARIFKVQEILID